jgi:hypothetical protein
MPIVFFIVPPQILLSYSKYISLFCTLKSIYNPIAPFPPDEILSVYSSKFPSTNVSAPRVLTRKHRKSALVMFSCGAYSYSDIPFTIPLEASTSMGFLFCIESKNPHGPLKY